MNKSILNFKFVLIFSILASLVHAEELKLPPIESATFDDGGRVLVNGKPFFPIMIYDAPTDVASLKLLHDWGFNTLPASNPEETVAWPANGFYAIWLGPIKADQRGGILFAVGMDSPALNFKEHLIEKVRADVEKVHKNVLDRPTMHAIGYWENEPAGVISNSLPSKMNYEDIVNAIEVAAPYLYPVPYQPVTSVGEAVQRAKKASDGHKPVFPVLQLFVWDAKDRYPTPAELKCMVYLSLINGANGIGYYSYGYIAGKAKTTNIAAEQPELWKSVRGINLEAAAIGSHLAKGASDPSVSLGDGAPEVPWRAIRSEDRGLVLLANTANAARNVTLQFAATSPSNLKRLDTGKEVAIQGGKAALTLAPLEAVGLEWTSKPGQ